MTRHMLFALAALAAACAPAAPAAEAPSEAHAVAEDLFLAFNRHDADALAALYAPEAVLTSPDYCNPRRGPDEIRAIYADLFAGVPDVQDEEQDYVVDGNRVAVRFVARSRAPGREFALPIASFLEVRDGRIVSDHSYFNTGAQSCRD